MIWAVLCLLFSSHVLAQDTPYYLRGVKTDQDMGGLNASFHELATRQSNRLTTTLTPDRCAVNQALLGAYYHNGAVWGGACFDVISTTGSGGGPTGPAGGDLVGTYPNPTLAASGVTAATYGSATQVSVTTYDAKGRATSASNVTISGVAPGGSASGDLAGTYPGPWVRSATDTFKVNGVIQFSTVTAALNSAGHVQPIYFNLGNGPSKLGINQANPQALVHISSAEVIIDGSHNNPFYALRVGQAGTDLFVDATNHQVGVAKAPSASWSLDVGSGGENVDGALTCSGVITANGGIALGGDLDITGHTITGIGHMDVASIKASSYMELATGSQFNIDAGVNFSGELNVTNANGNQATFLSNAGTAVRGLYVAATDQDGVTNGFTTLSDDVSHAYDEIYFQYKKYLSVIENNTTLATFDYTGKETVFNAQADFVSSTTFKGGQLVRSTSTIPTYALEKWVDLAGTTIAAVTQDGTFSVGTTSTTFYCNYGQCSVGQPIARGDGYALNVHGNMNLTGTLTGLSNLTLTALEVTSHLDMDAGSTINFGGGSAAISGQLNVSNSAGTIASFVDNGGGGATGLYVLASDSNYGILTDSALGPDELYFNKQKYIKIIENGTTLATFDYAGKSTVFDAPVTVKSGSSMTIVGAELIQSTSSTPSHNLQQWNDLSGATVAAVRQDGAFVVGPSSNTLYCRWGKCGIGMNTPAYSLDLGASGSMQVGTLVGINSLSLGALELTTNSIFTLDSGVTFSGQIKSDNNGSLSAKFIDSNHGTQTTATGIYIQADGANNQSYIGDFSTFATQAIQFNRLAKSMFIENGTTLQTWDYSSKSNVFNTQFDAISSVTFHSSSFVVGASSLVVTAAGVGIATNTPVAMLTVGASTNTLIATNIVSAVNSSGTNAGFAVHSQGNSELVMFAESGGAGSFGTSSNHTLKLITNNTERARIDTSGNVGIGTTGPGAKLEVVGGSNLHLSSATSGTLASLTTTDTTQLGCSEVSGSTISWTSQPGGSGNAWLNAVASLKHSVAGSFVQFGVILDGGRIAWENNTNGMTVMTVPTNNNWGNMSFSYLVGGLSAGVHSACLTMWSDTTGTISLNRGEFQMREQP